LYFLFTLAHLYSKLTINWLDSAVAVRVPADMISKFVRAQHQVSSDLTLNLCERWLKHGLTRLRESRTSSSGDVGNSVSSNLQILSAVEYPKELLRSASFLMDELGIDINPALLESVVVSLFDPDFVSPASLCATHEDPMIIDLSPSGGKSKNKELELSLLPSSTVYDGVHGIQELGAQEKFVFGEFDNFASAFSAISTENLQISDSCAALDVQSHHDISSSASLPAVERSQVGTAAAHRPDDDAATHRLARIVNSSEPRERVFSLLESFVFEELAKDLDSCYSAHNANANPNLRALVLGNVSAPGVARSTDGVLNIDAHLQRANCPDDCSDACVMSIGANCTEAEFRAANAVCISSVAPVSTLANFDYLRSSLSRGRNRVYVSALSALTNMPATVEQLHRIADICLNISHSIDINALKRLMDGSNASVAPLCRSLIVSVLLPNDLIGRISLHFSEAFSSILSTQNDGACMDAHLLLPSEVFVPSHTSLETVFNASSQHVVGQTASDKALLALKFARIIFQQTKLASLHAYCVDGPYRTAASTFRDSPAAHTELAKMDAAVDQVERWLRNPSAFNACLSAAGFEALVADQTSHSHVVPSPAADSSPLSDVSDRHISTSSALSPRSTNASSLVSTPSAAAVGQLDILSLVSLKVRPR
jgi:hypothetical protein